MQTGFCNLARSPPIDLTAVRETLERSSNKQSTVSYKEKNCPIIIKMAQEELKVKVKKRPRKIFDGRTTYIKLEDTERELCYQIYDPEDHEGRRCQYFKENGCPCILGPDATYA